MSEKEDFNLLVSECLDGGQDMSARLRLRQLVARDVKLRKELAAQLWIDRMLSEYYGERPQAGGGIEVRADKGTLYAQRIGRKQWRWLKQAMGRLRCGLKSGN